MPLKPCISANYARHPLPVHLVSGLDRCMHLDQLIPSYPASPVVFILLCLSAVNYYHIYSGRPLLARLSSRFQSHLYHYHFARNVPHARFVHTSYPCLAPHLRLLSLSFAPHLCFVLSSALRPRLLYYHRHILHPLCLFYHLRLILRLLYHLHLILCLLYYHLHLPLSSAPHMHLVSLSSAPPITLSSRLRLSSTLRNYHANLICNLSSGSACGSFPACNNCTLYCH